MLLVELQHMLPPPPSSLPATVDSPTPVPQWPTKIFVMDQAYSSSNLFSSLSSPPVRPFFFPSAPFAIFFTLFHVPFCMLFSFSSSTSETIISSRLKKNRLMNDSVAITAKLIQYVLPVQVSL